MKVLIIGAHPDDYELGMGGTIAKHVKDSDEVYSIIVSDGEKIGSAEERKKEAKKSSEFLKIKKVYFLGLPDTKISEGSETIDKIEEIVNDINPDRVYTHSSFDTHQDHRNVSKATVSACRNVKHILFFESPSSENDFCPNFFVDISDYLQIKIDALNIYKSLEKNGSKRYLEIEAIKGGAYFRGYQAGLKYAEAFKVFRIIED